MSSINRKYLFFTVFTGGMTTLAIEFVASRIIQTVYGTSNIVWANVIGLVLLFLTLGYFLGGRLADKYPRPRIYYGLATAGGGIGLLFLLLAQAINKTAAAALASFDVGAVAGSLVGVIIALAVPITLLGTLSPFAIRLGVRDVGEAGRISGQIYAISTLGSLLGTYLPVLFVIPQAGTTNAAVIFSLPLIIVGLIGLWRHSGQTAVAFILAGLFLLGPLAYRAASGPIKQYDGQLYETESAYNYVQVVQRDGCNYLLLNEGQAYHSYWCPDGRIPRLSVWGTMLAAPFFNAPDDRVRPERMAVIGLAAGTIPKQYARLFPDLHADGIEIDPAVVQAGYDYFELRDEQINVIVGDGRYQLNQLDGEYDVITIDAYKVPYIPWHLTTADFFGEVRAQLTADGVVAVNVGRAPQDRSLVEAMTATMLTVFPTVHTVDVPGSLNTILFGTMRPTTFDNLIAHRQTLPATADDVLLARALDAAVSGQRPTVAGETIFTDERAPVETIVDGLVIRYILSAGLDGVPSVNR